MLGLRVPSPDQALLISGKKGAEGAPFKVVIGTRAFAMPMVTSCSYLTLAMQESTVGEPCVTKQGIQVNVKAVVAFKIPADEKMITSAGQRFLSDQKRMPTLVGQIFAGHLRSIVGSMSIEEIVTERQKLATEVLDGSKEELGKMGLIVDSFQIQSIDDAGSGYIDSMAAPQIAAVQRQAKIAQAQAAQEAEKAAQESARQQAQYRQATEIAQAQYDAERASATAEANQKSAISQASSQQATEVAQANASKETAVARAAADQEQNVARANADAATATAQARQQQQSQVAQAEAAREINKARAEAEQAGALATAVAKQAVTEAETRVATQTAELREQQLIADVVKPAEAAAKKTRMEAEAQGAAMEARAKAAASSNRVQLDQELIQQLPEMVRAAASGLQGANVTMLDGTDGMGKMAMSFVTQGLSMFELVRQGLQQAKQSHADTAPEEGAEATGSQEQPNGLLGAGAR